MKNTHALRIGDRVMVKEGTTVFTVSQIIDKYRVRLTYPRVDGRIASAGAMDASVLRFAEDQPKVAPDLVETGELKGTSYRIYRDRDGYHMRIPSQRRTAHGDSYRDVRDRLEEMFDV